ncbi:MAG TPA: glycosyltransferase family 2 protein [Pyrinomonadaceae bacterium]|nr:glycosyltransferase family 2 protein [Pyrinomonadaceae bacterium]
MEAIFWLSVAAIGYAYVGYPLLLIVLSRLRPRPVRSSHWTPSVTVIIAAYNEERDLAAKLENTLALDYPPSHLEIIVTSDCSSDRTDEIARSFASRGVRLHRQEERHGKTAAQNAAVTKAKGEIIVFSDATTHYRPDVLRLMVPAFADQSVGCVTGRVIYQDEKDSSVGTGTQSYWNYEFFLKKHESAVCSLIGVCGCMYAVRASAYIPLYNEACSDFIIATTMVEQGLRAVYVPEAVCSEEPNRQSKKELAARVRIISQTFSDLWRNRSVLNPFRHGFYAVELWSHKVMRYLVPVFLILIFIASAVLVTRSAFYAAVFVLQVAFYLAALASSILERLGVTFSLLALPQYFVITNLASLIAFVKFVTGERYTRWEPSRE